MAILDLRTPQDWPDGPRAVVEEAAEEIRRRIDSGLYDDESDEDWDDPDLVERRRRGRFGLKRVD